MTKDERLHIADQHVKKIEYAWTCRYGGKDAVKLMREVERQLKERRLNEQRGHNSAKG